MMKHKGNVGNMRICLGVVIMQIVFGLLQFEAFSASRPDVKAESAEKSDEALSDTLKVTDLDDFVVDGRTQRVVKYGVEYYPDKKTKKISRNGIDLLCHMQIPQLDVSPFSTVVKTLSGSPFSVFINYLPATSEEIAGLRPEDVVRVEVLHFPDDPRLGSAANVVNFIMVKYEWGGYTTVEGSGATFGMDRGSGRVYSKFATGKWTLDASGSADIAHKDMGDIDITQDFRNVEYGGVVYPEITRHRVEGKNYLSQSNSQWASVRLAYSDSTSEIFHSISFNRNGTPRIKNTSDVAFSAAIPESTACSEAGSQSISPTVNGYYMFTLPAGNSILATWNFSYGANKYHSIYRLGELSEIKNSSREKIYAPYGTLQYSKLLGHDNILRTMLWTSNSIYSTDYAGSYGGKQKLVYSDNVLYLDYIQSWNCGLGLFSRVGVSYVHGRVNGINELSEWNPRLSFQLQYRPDIKNYLDLEGSFGDYQPSPSDNNTALVQKDELLWVQGNPYLRNTQCLKAKLTYSYIPINEFSMTAALEYNGNWNKQAIEYYDLPGINGLVSRTINSGQGHRYTSHLVATGRLLKNSLILKLWGSAQRQVLTGCDAQSLNMLYAYASALYMIDNFSVMLYYYTSRHQLSAWSLGERKKTPSDYGISMNYAVGNLKFACEFSNWFRKKGFITAEMQTERFDSYKRQLDLGSSRSISLSVQYTFAYGKKIDRNEDLYQGSGLGSSVLH